MKFRYLKPVLFSLGFCSLLTFSSCRDFLDVENNSNDTPSIVFNSTDYANSALVGVYGTLIGDDGYGSRISILYPQAADDFKTSGDFNPLDRRGIGAYGAHPANTELNRPFLQLYQGIARANMCIKYIPLSDLYQNGSESQKATMRRLHGEALTLRAQFYHELLRNWGDLPAHFQPSEDEPDLYLAKTDRDVIYDKILDDLKEAEALVPWRSEFQQPTTRITKAAVKGLRARIALARGGYSLRRETRMMERRADYLKYYEIARQECLDIIQRGENGLNPSFENLFKTLHTSSRQDPTNEWIFEVGAFGGNARTDSKLGYANGIRINANSKFGHANGGVEALPTYFYEFHPEADSRRDVTLAYFEVNGEDNKLLTTSLLMRDGKFRKYWTNISGTNQTLGINWPILRYADILLMFAEAENELNGASGLAINALEQVRKRAYAGHLDKMEPIPTDKVGFFNAIVKERLLEFGGEGIRKYDLIRWNLLNTKIQETRVKLRQFLNGTGPYENVPTHVYFKPSPVKNTTVKEEIASIELFGGPASKVFFEPGLGTSTAPTGFTTRNWRAAMNEDYITSPLRGYVIAFEPNRKELFPIFDGILNQNFKLTQDYGY